MTVALVVAGPPRHGVVRFGIDLAKALLRHDPSGRFQARHYANVRDVSHVSTDDGMHVQFTDKLFGSDPLQAAVEVRSLGERLAAARVPLTVTLHDVPQTSDGDSYATRVECYSTVAAVNHGVVVNSQHEAALLREAGIDVPARVIPLPIPRIEPVGTSATSRRTPSVAILGFLYPGKGHAELLDAAAALPQEYEVVALGEPSAGHAHLVADLCSSATARGRRFRITGHVDDGDLAATLAATTIPVAPHRHVSASGSINTWLAAGRRPLVPDHRYAREFVARNPRSLVLYDDSPEGFREALLLAAIDTATTWLDPGTVLDPSEGTVALRYAETLNRWHS